MLEESSTETTCELASLFLVSLFLLSPFSLTLSRNVSLPQRSTESQAGLPLLLDIGIMNTQTCEPLVGVFVDIWFGELSSLSVVLSSSC